MQPLEIADSQISYNKTKTQLVIDIPSYPLLKQLLKIANRNPYAWKQDEEGFFGESFVGSLLVVFTVYVLPLTAIQKIILDPILPETWFTFIISIFFVCYLGGFTYNLNGSVKLELTPQNLQLYRKIHLFGYCLKIRTADIQQIQTLPWRKIRYQESELRVLCFLVTKQRSYQLGRAISRAEAEWLITEVTKFLETYRASNDIS